METNNNIEKDNLSESEPKLFSINKENPFDVPADYFENLASVISEKSFHAINKKYKPTYIKILIPAAITTIMVFAILFFFNKNNNNNKSNTSTQLAYNNKGTFDYLNNMISSNELDESLIVSAFVNDDTTKTGTQQKDINNISFDTNPINTNDTLNNKTISKEDIIQYLLDNYDSDDLLN